MEVIDLDKVLDDFELSEGNCSPVVPGKEATPSGLQQYLEQQEDLHSLNLGDEASISKVGLESNVHPKLPPGILYDTPYNPIDIAEADFGPAEPRNPNLIVQEIEANKVGQPLPDLNAATAISSNIEKLNSFITDGDSYISSGQVPERNGVIENAENKTDTNGGQETGQDELNISHTNGEISEVEKNSLINSSEPVNNGVAKSETSILEKVEDEVPANLDESMPGLVNASTTEPTGTAKLNIVTQLEEVQDGSSCAASSDMQSDSELSMSLSEVPSSSGQSDNLQMNASPQMSTETSPAHTTMEVEPVQVVKLEAGEGDDNSGLVKNLESVDCEQLNPESVNSEPQNMESVDSGPPTDSKVTGIESTSKMDVAPSESLPIASVDNPSQSIESMKEDTSANDVSVEQTLPSEAPVTDESNKETLQNADSSKQMEVVGFHSDDEDIEEDDMEAYFSDMVADDAMLSSHSLQCSLNALSEALVSGAPVPEVVPSELPAPQTSVPEVVSDSSMPEARVPEVSIPNASMPEVSMPEISMPEASVANSLPSSHNHVSESNSSELGSVSTDISEPPKVDSNTLESVSDIKTVEDTVARDPADERDPKTVLQSRPVELAISGVAEERRGSDESCESVEKFLTIPMASPVVATPMDDDSGFSKVPGYVPDAHMSALTEEETPEVEECPPSAMNAEQTCVAPASESLIVQANISDNVAIPSDLATADTKESRPMSLSFAPVEKENTPPFGASGPSSLDSDPGKVMTGIGARPKDPNFAKKNRPNTLFGLSKPDLNLAPPASQEPDPMVVESAVPETVNPGSYPQEMYENSHDVINRQLAQNKRSPLRKKQLNLEIQQQLNEERAFDEHRMIDNKMMEAEALIQGDIPVDLYRRKDPSPGQADPAGPAFQAGVEPSLSLPAPGGEAGGKQKRPNTLNIVPTSGGVTLMPDEDPSPPDGPGSASSAGHTPFMPQEGSVSSGFGPPGLEAGPGAFSPPLSSANMNVSITQLGKVAPHWVPDADAPNCMECASRFTFTKRRHHCRACGKVFCSACCNLKCKLHYMDNKEARVCSKCYQDIVRAQVYENLHSPTTGLAGPDAEGGSGSGNRSPNPNNPSEYCSTVPILQQAQATLHAPPPTVMVPVGVLRKEGSSHEFESSTSPSGPKVEQGSQRNREPKQVMFSDGIRPGGDLTELDGSPAPRTLMRKSGRSARKVERNSGTEDKSSSNSSSTSSSKAGPKTKKIAEVQRSVCLIPDHGLPPVILSTGVKGDYSVEENPDPEKILPQISNNEASPVVFAINKNLFVLVKIVNLACCVNRTCWCFTTQGMSTVGQDEMVIVLECLPDEKTIPRDIFCHFNSVYEEAGKGNTVSHLGHTIFGQSFLDSKDHCGFLYVRPSFQCLQKLSLPPAPYIFGILLQRWETPWAKVFPLRLMLRLGAEFRYYPCPLISVRFRKPVYGEIGHTIMNLLADFTNFQYMLPQIKGVSIHMEDKKTYINFPKNKYDEVMKVINNSNDHVMALGANFSMEADSHLVCIQNEEGNYQTQAINIQNKSRQVTGASFVVFNGALKTSSGLRGKSSIVEDGLMVQITPESMASLKQALRDMKDYTIGCGSLEIMQPEEQVFVQWIEEDRNVNVGVKSPIDGMRMDGIESVHIHLATDYVGENHRIRWTEVFFIENDEPGNTRCEPVDLSRLADTLAKATCVALTGHLDKLKEAGLTRVGLRATIDADKVGYEVGAGGEKLPDLYMNDLDNELIPVIHNAASNSQNGSVVLELIFHIIE